MKEVIFITGIGTNVGKSFATGWLATQLNLKGCKTITLKMIQTGNDKYSEDIDIHRKIMNIDYTEYDMNFVTAPIIMSYPASPHLAAKIDNVDIDLSKIDVSIEKLFKEYDTILMEGAGGLMVPIREDYLTIDYISEYNYDTCLVINGTLGSINHILLSLEALERRNIKLKYVIYNSYFDDDDIICDETKKFIEKVISDRYPDTIMLFMPNIKLD